jgi:hypothetical protein
MKIVPFLLWENTLILFYFTIYKRVTLVFQATLVFQKYPIPKAMVLCIHVNNRKKTFLLLFPKRTITFKRYITKTAFTSLFVERHFLKTLTKYRDK